MLYLYNSQSRKKEKFTPINDRKVKIYVCGITPYDTTHLGHAFTYVFFDVLVRYLKFKGYHVEYTQNVTDIDDDILKKAKEESRNWKELGNFWTDKFLKDMKALNVIPPTNFVKATGSIDTIVEIVKLLIDKEFAYQKNGNVYFEVKKFKDYGKLSKFKEKQMILLAKERGGNPEDPLKKNPLDFLLWQGSKEGEPFWESPWGKGRPGWHIECSAMIKDYLGDQIDIHGGGRDLIFPHHESEIAQSEGYTDKKPFVKYWVHTSMVMHQGEKMAKSLGNLVMISDLLRKYNAIAIRWVLLSHNYRTAWEFDENELKDAEKALKNVIPNGARDTQRVPRYARKDNDFNKNLKHFVSLMDDDMNTSDGLKFILNLPDKQAAAFYLSILGFNFHQRP